MTAVHEGWANFFVAMVGAGAALAGLIIVTMSVTIRQIVSSKVLPARAGATIASLMLVVVVAGLGLVPGQVLRVFGLEVLIATFITTVFAVVSFVRIAGESQRPIIERATKIAASALPLVPFLVGGMLVGGNAAVGCGWIATGMLLTFVVSMANVWVLLVEVQR